MITEPMHVVNSLDLWLTSIVCTIGCWCFYTAIDIWKLRNGGWYTRVLCLVLAVKGIWGLITGISALYLWKSAIPIPSLVHYLGLGINLVNAICWLFILLIVLPLTRK